MNHARLVGDEHQVAGALVVEAVRRLRAAVEHLVDAGELGAQPADRLEVGGVVDVDVRDLVVGDGEGPRGPRVEVLHAVLGVDLEQPAAAQHPVDVDGLVGVGDAVLARAPAW